MGCICFRCSFFTYSFCILPLASPHKICNAIIVADTQGKDEHNGNEFNEKDIGRPFNETL